MRQAGPVIEDSGVAEGVRRLGPMPPLPEVAREQGSGAAAATLGIDPGTGASRMGTGRSSWRVREAPLRALLHQSHNGATLKPR